MKRVVDDEMLMLQVCEMYYNKGLGQKDIAAQLKLSRPTVSKILTNARDTGMVRIIIADLSGRNYVNTEEQLIKSFGLKAAIVTESFEEEQQQENELARAAAKYLERILRDNDVIGISMGSTLSHIAQHITADYFSGIHVVPMMGGSGATAIELHSNSLAESLARALNGTSSQFHAPAMVSRIQTKKELLQEASIASILQLASNLNIALSGIGAPDETSTIIQTGYFNKEMIEDFRKYNICGDICMNFYDEEGNLSACEHNQRVIGVNIGTLRKIHWSLGVAGGVRKAGAIMGALKGKYINVLITDLQCAEKLLNAK